MASKSAVKKGQWFLISAVFASGALLAISVLFRDYFVIDSSRVALMDEDFYFNDIRYGMNETLANHCPDNGEGTRKLKEFIEFSRQKMQEKGYLLFVGCSDSDCQVVCSQNLQQNFPLILLKSHRMESWEGNRPEIEKFEFGFNPANSEFQSIDIDFRSGMGYGFDVNASVFYNVSSEVRTASAIKTANTDKIKFTANDFSLDDIYRNDIKHSTASNPALVGETKFYP